MKLPEDALRLTATHLGPVASMDALLSKHAQNLIYARNGTGKSFLSRALRYLDLHAQGFDVTDAAFALVSEEAADSKGSFSLSKGGTNYGDLSLNCSGNSVKANSHNRIFHVFSEDFVHSELRQQNFDPDGNIENSIQLDQTNIDTKSIEAKIDIYREEIDIRKIEIGDILNSSKTDDLVGKASVRRQLTEFIALTAERLMAVTIQPKLPDRSFKDVVSDLDSLKSIPADPKFPTAISRLQPATDSLNCIIKTIRKVTSPSTVSMEIKQKLGNNPEFFEKGIALLKQSETDNCPFCHQSIDHPSARDRIEMYLAYFADAEGKHKKELRSAWADATDMRTTIKDRFALISGEIIKYEALRKLIPSLRDAALPEFSEVYTEIDDLFGNLLAIIETKSASPSVVLGVPDDDITPLINVVNIKIDAINDRFNSINQAVNQSDNERRRLQREACAAFEQEFIHSHWSKIEIVHSHYSLLSAAQMELDELKKSQLTASVKERVADTFDSLITSFFGNKYSFDRTDFTLRRNDKKMARGVSRTLSDGEKTAIAFCYFISCVHKKVKSSSDYGKLFLVFDDPITSMSYDFVFSISQTLKNMTISASGEISINPASIRISKRPDLIIFTHSSHFYNTCVTNRVVKDGAAFFLHNNGSTHKISRRDQFVTPFEQHLKEIVDVHSGQDPSHTTGNAIRCVIEAIGRFCHPEKSSLTDFITYLAGDGGFEVKSVLIK